MTTSFRWASPSTTASALPPLAGCPPRGWPTSCGYLAGRPAGSRSARLWGDVASRVAPAARWCALYCEGATAVVDGVRGPHLMAPAYGGPGSPMARTVASRLRGVCAIRADRRLRRAARVRNAPIAVWRPWCPANRCFTLVQTVFLRASEGPATMGCRVFGPRRHINASVTRPPQHRLHTARYADVQRFKDAWRCYPHRRRCGRDAPGYYVGSFLEAR